MIGVWYLVFCVEASVVQYLLTKHKIPNTTHFFIIFLIFNHEVHPPILFLAFFSFGFVDGALIAVADGI